MDENPYKSPQSDVGRRRLIPRIPAWVFLSIALAFLASAAMLSAITYASRAEAHQANRLSTVLSGMAVVLIVYPIVRSFVGRG